MHYKLILLDIDDTLIDFHKCEREALSKLFLKFNIAPSPENFAHFNKENKSVWALFEKGQVKQSEINTQRFSQFLKAIDIDTSKRLTEIAESYLDFLSQEHHLLEGATAFVQSLSAHFKLAVLTNGFTSVQKKRLEGSGLISFFDSVFISEEIGYSKPNKEIFNHVLKKYPHFERKNILMVGDSLGSDILGANHAKIDSCWLNPKMAINYSSAIPTFTAQNYKDLIHWIFKKNALQL